MDTLTETVREAYADFLHDPDQAWSRLSPDVVFHVAGDHPLSGDHVGVEAVRRYVAEVTRATNGRGGFSVTSAFTDDSGELLLVEGTAFHGEEPFVRTILHLLRIEDGVVVEFWDNPFDQRAEDRFWAARFPSQRHRPVAAAARPGGANGGADGGADGEVHTGVPAQLMRVLGRA
jgi:ketosteroid isomerase-like protein